MKQIGLSLLTLYRADSPGQSLCQIRILHSDGTADQQSDWYTASTGT